MLRSVFKKLTLLSGLLFLLSLFILPKSVASAPAPLPSGSSVPVPAQANVCSVGGTNENTCKAGSNCQATTGGQNVNYHNYSSFKNEHAVCMIHWANAYGTSNGWNGNPLMRTGDQVVVTDDFIAWFDLSPGGTDAVHAGGMLRGLWSIHKQGTAPTGNLAFRSVNSNAGGMMNELLPNSYADLKGAGHEIILGMGTNQDRADCPSYSATESQARNQVYTTISNGDTWGTDGIKLQFQSWLASAGTNQANMAINTSWDAATQHCTWSWQRDSAGNVKQAYLKYTVSYEFGKDLGTHPFFLVTTKVEWDSERATPNTTINNVYILVTTYDTFGGGTCVNSAPNPYVRRPAPLKYGIINRNSGGSGYTWKCDERLFVQGNNRVCELTPNAVGSPPQPQYAWSENVDTPLSTVKQSNVGAEGATGFPGCDEKSEWDSCRNLTRHITSSSSSIPPHMRYVQRNVQRIPSTVNGTACYDDVFSLHASLIDVRPPQNEAPKTIGPGLSWTLKEQIWTFGVY